MKQVPALRPALAAAAALACWPAGAMMPPAAYDDAMAAAEIHLQLAVTGRDLVPVTPGYGRCIFAGAVVRVFRGAVEVGEQLSVAVPCRHEQADIPVGGAVFAPVGELASAAFLELVLEHDAGHRYRTAAEGEGVAVIDGPSPEPAINLPE